MDFEYSPKVQDLRARVREFMDRYVIPNAARWRREVAAGLNPPPVIEELKAIAKSEGLWNLFLPGLKADEPGTRLTNLEYAPLAEIMGQLQWASEVFNCSAPDTGNMELLHLFATSEQRGRWLNPLLEGEIRSCFAMTGVTTRAVPRFTLGWTNHEQHSFGRWCSCFPSSLRQAAAMKFSLATRSGRKVPLGWGSCIQS